MSHNCSRSSQRLDNTSGQMTRSAQRTSCRLLFRVLALYPETPEELQAQSRRWVLALAWLEERIVWTSVA